MTDEEFEAALNASLDAYVTRATRALVAALGKSPEAVRGAMTVASMLASGVDAVLGSGTADDADHTKLLTVQLALLNKIMEVLGGE